ncbi:MAG: alpha-ketoacid dehydrogenase subunit beta [Candidatus Margulisbacteria bacterium]|nr:alpha-ketoacid dehydrogenase subunit beta [Candidatus Margulisiibacteriota bacterium]
MQNNKTLNYADGILQAFTYLLENHKEVFVFGQGLWSPWYVGSTMKDLDKKFGVERVIDSPVSEVAVTGAAIGASVCGYRPIVVHPRVDFMILAIDQIVSQAAKWSSMFGGQVHPAVTIRGIVNRGGEQGAQHSQALHAWFAHVPGLRVVMPATARDARDLLIASVLCDDPVLYIDDRWLYEWEEEDPGIQLLNLSEVGPHVLKNGNDITIVAASFSTKLAMDAAKTLEEEGISVEVVDLRVINPIHWDVILESVQKTGRLLAVDGGWQSCGLAGEIIAGVMEHVPLAVMKASPKRLTLTNAPAPTSKVLEEIYYTQPSQIISAVKEMIGSKVHV